MNKNLSFLHKIGKEIRIENNVSKPADGSAMTRAQTFLAHSNVERGEGRGELVNSSEKWKWVKVVVAAGISAGAGSCYELVNTILVQDCI